MSTLKWSVKNLSIAFWVLCTTKTIAILREAFSFGPTLILSILCQNFSSHFLKLLFLKYFYRNIFLIGLEIVWKSILNPFGNPLRQIQFCNIHTNWQPKFKMAMQIQHCNTNTILVTQMKVGKTNTFCLTQIQYGNINTTLRRRYSCLSYTASSSSIKKY